MRSRIHLKSIIICAAIVLFGSGYAVAGTWTAFEAPEATGVTIVRGISGNNIVGYYQDNSGPHSFLYNWGSWTELPITNITSIDGSTIVSGSGERYNLTTGILTPASVEFIGSHGSTISGISGNIIIGQCSSVYGVERSFLYNTTTKENYTYFDYPGAAVGETYAYGISGNSVVGWYRNSSGDIYGFLHNTTTQSYNTLEYPGATGGTIAQGISGNNIVGQYQDSSGSHGFFYNGTSWTSLSYPGAMNTYAYGISGNNIIGIYNDGSGSPSHSFVYTIPEPATILLFGLGAVTLRKRRVYEIS